MKIMSKVPIEAMLKELLKVINRENQFLCSSFILVFVIIKNISYKKLQDKDSIQNLRTTNSF